MQPQQLYLLLLLIDAAVPAVFDKSGSDSSVTAPASYRQELLGSAIRAGRTCAYKCSIDPVCFGFHYRLLQGTVADDGACNFFTIQAYYDAPSWLNCSAGGGTLAHCDIFVKSLLHLFGVTGRLQIAGCSQSSTDHGGHCNRAINGGTSQLYGSGSCSHTGYKASEWWEADLAATSLVSHVTIYNRQDCCPSRLNRFDLLVDGATCQQVSLSAPFSVANFTCGAVGSRVRVLSRTNPPQPVTICEFVAYGFQLP